VAEEPGAAIDRKALRAERARLGRFFETIAKHRRALDLATEEGFGGRLEPAEWRSAFDSAEPRDANRTMVVTGDHSATLGWVATASSSRERRLETAKARYTF
jgi:hypothetical protein